MGERNWVGRYKDSKRQADSAATDLAQGRDVHGWHYEPAWMPGETEPPRVQLQAASWVAWLYEIALENARALVQVHGKGWQYTVNECEHLMQEYRAKTVQP